MSEDVEHLREALENASLEEQKKLLEVFMFSRTDECVLEGIRIANESYASDSQGYIVSSHVKE